LLFEFVVAGDGEVLSLKNEAPQDPTNKWSAAC